jgi:pyruvate formate lyase activating enzyme
MIEIKRLVESSFTDWPGRISAVIYVGGCNLKCPWCYAVDLVETPDKIKTIPWSKVRNYLERAKTFVDGVVITGGEPTMHEDLPDLCRKIRSAGYQIRIEINGTCPEMIEQLINSKLVDFIALDVKNQLDIEKYSRAIGLEADEFLKKIRRTISILRLSDIPYEFRTTVVPNIHTLEDVRNITRHLGMSKSYIIQPYLPRETVNPRCSNMKPFDNLTIGSFVRMAQKIIPNTTKR